MARLTERSVWAQAVDGDRIAWGEGMGRDVQIFSGRLDGRDPPTKLWDANDHPNMQLAHAHALIIVDGDVYFIASHIDADHSAKLWRLGRSGGAPTVVVSAKMLDSEMELAYDTATKRLYASDLQKVLVISLSERTVVKEVVREGRWCNRLLIDADGDALCIPEADVFNDFYYADLRAAAPSFKRIVTTGPRLSSGPISLSQGRIYANVRAPNSRPFERHDTDSFTTFDAKTGATVHTGRAAPVTGVELQIDHVAGRQDGSACLISNRLYCRIGQAGAFKEVAKRSDLGFQVTQALTLAGSRAITAGPHGLIVVSVPGL